MCVVSNIGDAWQKAFPERYPWVQPYVYPQPNTQPVNVPSREEFERLRQEVRELRDLLIAAKHFDEVTGQPDCEVDEKVALIKRIAEFVGVDLKDVLE